MAEIEIDKSDRAVCIVIGNNHDANIRAFKSFVRMRFSASRWMVIGDDNEINAVLSQFLLQREDCEIYPSGTLIPQGNIFLIDATNFC